MKFSLKLFAGSAGLIGGLLVLNDSKIQAKISQILPSFISPSRVLNVR